MESKRLYIIALLVNSVSYVVCVLFNILLSAEGSADQVGVKATTGDVARNVSTPVLPAGWTFSIWSLIYICQALWIIYSWSFYFRPKAEQTVHIAVHIVMSVSSALNVTWLYVFGNEQFIVSFLLLFLLELILDLQLAIIGYTTERQAKRLIENGQKIDVVLTQVLLCNGFSIYEAWVTLAVQVNFAIVLQYEADLSSTTTAIVIVSIVLAEMIGWFVAEVTVLDRYLRYVLVTYPVVVWTFIGIVTNNWQSGEAGSIFSLVTLCIAVCLAVARVTIVIIYEMTRPLRWRVVAPPNNKSNIADTDTPLID